LFSQWIGREARLRPFKKRPRIARSGLVSNDGLLCIAMAKQGLGLAYALESLVIDELSRGQLQRVLEPFAPTVPGYFIYFPSHAQRSTALCLFVDTAKELLRSSGK
jgi:DNA-binding transcriptional LysR family regulator